MDQFLLLKNAFHTSKLNKFSNFKVLLLEVLIDFQAHSQLLIIN